MFFRANRMASNADHRVRPGRPPMAEHPVMREVCLACARLYYDPDKKLSIAAIADVFSISDQTLRNRIRIALTIEGPEGDEIRRLAAQSQKRLIKPK